MIETDFFQTLLNLYNKIPINEGDDELAKIDSYITYYLADKQNQFIIVNKPNIIDIDITSAFPTIIKCMFGKDDPFVIDMFSKQTKKEKNIFIAISLKNTEYLRRINMICKMIIYGIIKENSKEHLLLELKKDGILIQCDNLNFDKLNFAINGEEYYKNSLTEYVLSKGFNFHITDYQSYIRCNRTSFFMKDNKLKIKGKYKYLPNGLINDLKNYLLDEDINLKELKRIYSKTFFNVIKFNYLKDIIDEYYICSNNKILDSDNKYVNYTYTLDVNPSLYLKNFVYPIIASKRI